MSAGLAGSIAFLPNENLWIYDRHRDYIFQGGTQSRQNYIPRNVDPKGGGAQNVITGAETGGEHISSADRCVEEEAGRIVGDPHRDNRR